MEPQTAIDVARRIYADPKLSRHQKHLQVMPLLRSLGARKEEARKELDSLRKKEANAGRLVAALQDMASAWGIGLQENATESGDTEFRLRKESIGSDIVIEKNDCSRLHRLADAIKAGDLLIADDTDIPEIPKQCMSVVVAHDWAALIQEADGDVNLPAPVCAFEYRFSGRAVLIVCSQEHEDRVIDGMTCYETKNGEWLFLGLLTGTWMAHVRAACIALDAEVAVRNVQRAPHALNVKREKAGKTPVFDTHIVDLAARHRVRKAGSAPTGSRKRLHFCRGHWRHYETSKTWIRWCLKGDPDLGFVDKEYRL